LRLEHHRKLPDIQFGFWKNKFCMDSLSLIYLKTVNTSDNSKIIGAVLIYITDRCLDEALPKLKNSARELSQYLNDSGLQLALKIVNCVCLRTRDLEQKMSG
jgi:hypothetical protein